MRADRLIVSRGLAPTRSAAQRLIDHHGVRWLAPGGWVVPRKAGVDLPDGCNLEVTDAAELRFVSRGGLKLDAALARCGIEARDRTCLDIGQGSGGFTDALLQRGAAHVVGIDVGHGQLHPRLAADPRVTSLEGVNARNVSNAAIEKGVAARSLSNAAFKASTPAGGFDIVVADLSFISLTLVLPTVAQQLGADGHALLLVKPQFELQPGDIGKGGLVRTAAAYPRVEARIRSACAAGRLTVRDYFASSIEGGDGNREFFAWARHTAAETR